MQREDSLHVCHLFTYFSLSWSSALRVTLVIICIAWLQLFYDTILSKTSNISKNVAGATFGKAVYHTFGKGTIFKPTWENGIGWDKKSKSLVNLDISWFIPGAMRSEQGVGKWIRPHSFSALQAKSHCCCPTETQQATLKWYLENIFVVTAFISLPLLLCVEQYL